MTDAPILLVLTLWSLGHSASDVAARTGLPSHKAVTRVVAQGRMIHDPRAVLHCGANGRLLGRPGRDGTTIRRGAKTVGRREVVMLISKAAPKPEPKSRKKAICSRGHARAPDNVGANGGCLACKRLARRLKEGRI